MDNLASEDHPLPSEQIEHQDWRLALRAVTAQADGSRKQVALRAATLTDEALTAVRAFVHGLRHQRAASPKFLAHTLEIHVPSVLAEAEGTLLAREQ